MAVPKITLEGKEYMARKRKVKQMKQYGRCLKEVIPAIQALLAVGIDFDSDKEIESIGKFADAFIIISEDENLEKCAEFIAATINHNEVTPERVIEELDGEDLIPLIIQCIIYVRTFVDMKVAQFPNG